jgi:hypothetical protein
MTECSVRARRSKFPEFPSSDCLLFDTLYCCDVVYSLPAYSSNGNRSYWSMTAVYHNSSLNTILYCCRLSVTRNSIRKLFCHESCSQNEHEMENLNRATMSRRRETTKQT